mmetsp:Transcript_21071/g.60120  ORF Transcript_21071/g.60120 Transcript_21071/m.60120 type:complete len:161 (+) Transcript_21071:978-1460(+)|eukprot:CAMPEP_0119550270 /NCGR_PEP_ID=MMETSP1352-20130426/3803_1 /TAXON_ID=265584 /ORGANISM="Stauroneis constricta, Strain CCMP1120" /LENGTH=160 /DNA_ID=CAMNT_0007596055 /DNA_START=879 /DNA_END=1361 /DNA_ORIENTATION=-
MKKLVSATNKTKPRTDLSGDGVVDDRGHSGGDNADESMGTTTGMVLPNLGWKHRIRRDFPHFGRQARNDNASVDFDAGKARRSTAPALLPLLSMIPSATKRLQCLLAELRGIRRESIVPDSGRHPYHRVFFFGSMKSASDPPFLLSQRIIMGGHGTAACW